MKQHATKLARPSKCLLFAIVDHWARSEQATRLAPRCCRTTQRACLVNIVKLIGDTDLFNTIQPHRYE